MSASFTLKKSIDGKYYFNLLAENNEKILTSETYNTKISAMDGITSVRFNSSREERYKRKVSSRGLNYFVLTAANNEIIGKSEEYSSALAMENGITAVKKNGSLAPLRDLT